MFGSALVLDVSCFRRVVFGHCAQFTYALQSHNIIDSVQTLRDYVTKLKTTIG